MAGRRKQRIADTVKPHIDSIREVLHAVRTSKFSGETTGLVGDLTNKLRALHESGLGSVIQNLGMRPENIVSEEEIIAGEEVVSRQRLDAFLFNNEMINGLFINSIYIVVIECYKEEFSAISNRRISVSNVQLANAVRRVFGHSGAWDGALNDDYFGDYQVYRPFHLNPANEIMLCALSVGPKAGTKRDFMSANLRFAYSRRGESVEEEVNGHFVRHGRKATMILGNTERLRFIVYVHRTGGSAAATRLKGIMLADAGGDDAASAWPFLAERLAEGSEAQLGVKSCTEVDVAVLSEIGRGAVHWQPHLFPGFGPQPAPRG